MSKNPGFGVLNDLGAPWISDRIDERNVSVPELFKTMVENIYSPSSVLNTGPYVAIVLRVDGQHTTPYPGSWSAHGREGDKAIPLRHIKCRIPELHSALPIPDPIGPQGQHAIIDLYPTFISQDETTPEPVVGGLVWVDFGNRNNFTNPIYIKPVSKSQNPKQVVNKPSAAQKFATPCLENGSNIKPPKGDIVSGKNKPLTHSGQPLNMRKPGSIISKEYKYIKGSRFSANDLAKWQKAIEKNGVPSTTWIGTADFNGLDDKEHNEGHRSTIICCPNTTNFTAGIELIYHFHGLGEFGNNYDFMNRYAPAVKKLSESGRNFILVIPEMPWSMNCKNGRAAANNNIAWKGNDHFANFHEEVMVTLKESFSSEAKVDYISIISHNQGAGAVANACQNGFQNVRPRRIVVTEGIYSNFVEVIYNYVNAEKNVEFSVAVVRDGLSFKNLQKFIATGAKGMMEVQDVGGKNHNEVGDFGLVFESAKTKENMQKGLATSATDAKYATDDEIEMAENGSGGLEPSLQQFPKQPQSKAPLPNGGDMASMAIQKTPTGKSGNKVVIKEAIPFTENRVKLSDYGPLQGNEGVLTGVPSVSGKQCLAHKLVATRHAAMNKAWMASHPGYPALLVSSGWRKKKWQNREEYEAYVIMKHGSVEEGKRWIAWDSPHEAALALDFYCPPMTPNKKTNSQQKESEVYKWLRENAHRFGFTPYALEAWHWEVRLPRESWVSGEEFVTDSNYAVRVVNPGATDGRMPQGNAKAVVLNCNRDMSSHIQPAFTNTISLPNNMKQGDMKLDEKKKLIKELSLDAGIDPEVVMAFAQIESGGKFTNPANNGKIVIRFNPNVFSKDTYMKKYGVDPKSVPWSGGGSEERIQKWKDLGFATGAGTSAANQQREYKNLEAAIQIDKQLAYASTAMGSFQALGDNYKTLGYKSPEEMFQAFSQSEEAQIRGFFAYVKTKNKGQLLQALKNRDFDQVAKMYSGKENPKYAGKLAKISQQYVNGRSFA